MIRLFYSLGSIVLVAKRRARRRLLLVMRRLLLRILRLLLVLRLLVLGLWVLRRLIVVRSLSVTRRLTTEIMRRRPLSLAHQRRLCVVVDVDGDGLGTSLRSGGSIVNCGSFLHNDGSLSSGSENSYTAAAESYEEDPRENYPNNFTGICRRIRVHTHA